MFFKNQGVLLRAQGCPAHGMIASRDQCHLPHLVRLVLMLAGSVAGASLLHPHSQIVAMPVVSV
jgi:ATP adenylyltransferase/5',5'''-P-1,P-4-tetraphosphate phosphorylase II